MIRSEGTGNGEPSQESLGSLRVSIRSHGTHVLWLPGQRALWKFCRKEHYCGKGWENTGHFLRRSRRFMSRDQLPVRTGPDMERIASCSRAAHDPDDVFNRRVVHKDDGRVTSLEAIVSTRNE